MHTIDNVTLAETESVKRIRNFLMNSNTSELKDEDWQNLRQEVERYYPTFREAMYQGEYLKPKEYNLCLLIKAD